MNETSSSLDFVMNGSAADVALYAPRIMDEVKTTILLPRWGQWQLDSLVFDLILCTHCLQIAAAADKTTVVNVTDDVKRSDIYNCGTNRLSYLLTQVPELKTSPVAPTDVLSWSHEQSCAWLRSVNPGFWRYIHRMEHGGHHAKLNGAKLLSLPPDAWRDDFGVTITDHWKQLESALAKLKAEQTEWQALHAGSMPWLIA